MSVEINHPDVNIKEEKTESEIGFDESFKSDGFLYVDMNVYNEGDESFDGVEIKEEVEEVTLEENRSENEGYYEETLPLNSIKNLTNHSQDEAREIIEKGNKKGAKREFSGKSIQKENVSIEGENSEPKRYRLRERTLNKKLDFNLVEFQLKTKKNNRLGNRKRTSVCGKCGEAFTEKKKLLDHKRERLSFKCLYCRKCFCSDELLESHMVTCKHSKLTKSYFEFDCEKCGECFDDTDLKKHLTVHDDISFKCQKCGGSFTEKTNLVSHIIENSCGTCMTYTCGICEETFTSKAILKKHIKAHIDNPLECSSQPYNPNICNICGKKFLQSHRLKVHLLQHEGLSYNCPKCSKTFTSQESLDNHSEGDCLMVHKCEKCGKRYKGSLNYTKHLQVHKDDLMKCNSCKEVFTDPSKFTDHRETCSRMKKLRYECDTCRKKFVKLVKLKIHILNIHQGINYQCERCSLKFPSQVELDAHAADQDCKPDDPCACKTCGKIFAKRDYLKKHQYMHMNVLFKCKYCYCAFMKEKSYKRHMEKMNCSKSARKIRMAEYNFRKCRICEVEYETEDLLIDHFKTSHPDQEPHQCFCCDSCLPTFQDLQNHIHHHNIQKYTCNLCGKPYTSQEGFRKHRLKHKGAEFKCRFCESEFLNESRFKFHEKTCKKNPESGYEPSQEKEKPKKKDDRPKQSRQLHWESRIIMKHLRGDPKSSTGNQTTPGSQADNSIASTFFDEPETESTNERGWFDNYYKTEEDDIAFGLKKDEETGPQDCDLDFDVTEFLQPGKKKKTGSPPSTNVPDSAEDFDVHPGADNCSESSTSDDSSTDSSEEEEGFEDLPIDYDPKKCRLCVISFGQEYELLHHFIKSHPGEYAHKCPNCEVQSPLFAQLKEHMKTHGIGIGVFNCDNCSKKFRSEKKMKSHNIRCKGMNEDGSATSNKISQSGKDRCKRCGKKFHTKFGYRRHKQLCKRKKNKHKTSEKSSTAVATKSKQEAMEDFAYDNDFRLSDREEDVPKAPKNKTDAQSDPEKAKVSTKQTDQVCSTPVAEEKKKAEVKDSYTGEPPMDSFPCRLCDKKFQYERGIVMHFKAAHPGNKPLICHVCNMHLADKLKEHLKTHGIGEEFICELCGKRFNQKFLSKIHEMWHQGIEYKCNNCKQKFLNKEKMDKHIGENRCSNRQSLMRLPCDICGKSYRSKFGLSKHYITHTPKELRPVKNRMNCEYCGKWFENNNGLQRHRRIHTGERPFCCRYCPKAFAQEGNCKAHERIHTGESKPRKKKLQQMPPPAPAPAQLQPPPPVVETLPYPGHINLYIYNTIDPTGIVH